MCSGEEGKPIVKPERGAELRAGRGRSGQRSGVPDPG